MKDVLRVTVHPTDGDHEPLITREWLVTNGLGGYASGTVGGVVTRRYHGLLISALPSPHGRVVVLNQLSEQVKFPDRRRFELGGEERQGSLELHGAKHLRDFRLELGLPVWNYDVEGAVIEKRVWMIAHQNTVHVRYSLLQGRGPVSLRLRPAIHFRPHEAPVNIPLQEKHLFTAQEDRFEIIVPNSDLPALRMQIFGEETSFTVQPKKVNAVLYRKEESRGYEHQGDLWSCGHFWADLSEGQSVTFVASTEQWARVHALPPDQAWVAETDRRRRLLLAAPAEAQSGFGAELVLAADQFIITPATRVEDAARAHAAGEEARTVIAGYHWFTDWGRDTMISLEGLTLQTGRHREARAILHSFAQHVRDGLIPNMFPEGDQTGLYHTADATLWFFHALGRYLDATNDRLTLERLIPTLVEIVEHHVRGTKFNIHMDPADSLLIQGEHGYQLTWMDAKMGDWVVTPRRGKAVEINALWYNALQLLARWLGEVGGEKDSRRYYEIADRAKASFIKRFWYEQGGYLYDVVDSLDEQLRDDPACRPNQIFAISLTHPVLDQSRWKSVMDVAEQKLLTPYGLRSLAPDHPEYKAQYFGDLRNRDGAYHQGTVWGWLIGPFVDAWLKVYPERGHEARKLLEGFDQHLGEACVGSISEIFDAKEPFTPRGCIAQAWSVAEVLRCWVKTAAAESHATKAA